jgi:ABC-type glycerol-3-phosphate transport system substrate-binding protein
MFIVNTNRLYYILVAVIAAVFLLTVVLILRSIGGDPVVTRDTLEFWGVFDDDRDFRPVIENYKRQTRTNINYTKFSFDDYERSLVNALAAGKGPDIFMVHHTWLPKHADKMAPMPRVVSGENAPLMTIGQFQEQYVDVVYDDLTNGDRIFAMPLYVDTLALYYNKDLFNTAGIPEPPKDWDEFNEDIEKLTRLDSRGNIVQSGAAIGTVDNINRSTDILMALMIQSGVKMIDDRGSAVFSKSIKGIKAADVALQYYTDFSSPLKRLYTWDDSLNYSVDSFVEGDTAMMFNYSHQTGVLRGKAPRLNFTIAPMPQIAPNDIKNYANYWAVAVANSSDKIDESWDFITYLTSKEGSSRYLSETLRPSARRDLINIQRSDADIGVFAVQGLSAKSWSQADNTAIELIFAEMINEINAGNMSISDALRNAEAKVNVLMRNRKI